MTTNVTGAERLTSIGFKKCGDWQCSDGALICALTENATAPNVLYAFVSEGIVLYIGKTVQQLSRRMYGYQKPERTQSTNIKGNAFIRDVLGGGKVVEVYALPDNGLLYYGGFHVNLAAGLEDSLINVLKPKWNGTKKAKK